MSGEDDTRDIPLDGQSENDNQDAVVEPKGKTPDGAASSDARDETRSDDDLLSVAREVIEGKVKKSAEAASSAESGDVGQESGSQVRKDKDNEAFSDVPFHTHPRFKELIAERNGLREDATRYRNVDTFIQNNGLTAESAAEALVIAGLMRTNPAEAWKQLQPTLQKLLTAAGEALPPELQRQVDSGQLPLEAALQVSRATAQVQSIEAQRALDRQRAERDQQESHTRSLREVADAWEADRQAKDPNFAAKAPALEREIVWLHRSEGVPKTVEGVRDQLKRAYEQVNKEFRPAQAAPPRRPATRPVMGGQTAAAGAPRPTNLSTLDIVREKVRQAAS